MTESESALSYLKATRTYLERHGKPIAFYCDKHSAFQNNTATGDSDGMSHLGRALAKFGVEIICANSPQAKRRVERANGTLQDRLVKAMRLAGIRSVVETNTFLPSYLHNTMRGSPHRLPILDTRIALLHPTRMSKPRWSGGSSGP